MYVNIYLYIFIYIGRLQNHQITQQTPKMTTSSTVGPRLASWMAALFPIPPGASGDAFPPPSSPRPARLGEKNW